MMYEGARNKVLTGKRNAFECLYISTKEALNGLNPIFLNPEATTKHTSTSRPPCHAIPTIVFFFLFFSFFSLLLLCFPLTYTLCVSVSLPVSPYEGLSKAAKPWLGLAAECSIVGLKGFCQYHYLHRPREHLHT